MTHTHNRRTAFSVVAAFTASALALASCISSEDAAEVASPDAAETAAPESAETGATEDTPKQNKSPFKKHFTAADLDTLEEAPADGFTASPMVFQVALPGIGTCNVPTEKAESTSAEMTDNTLFGFTCDAGEIDPESIPPEKRTPGIALPHSFLNYNPAVGFHAEEDKALEDKYVADATELKTGQKVTLNGFTIGRPDDETMILVRGAHTATVSGGETTIESPYQDLLAEGGNTLHKEQEAKDSAAPEGTVCGSFPYSQEGKEGAFVGIAVAPDTDCVGVMEAAKPYIDFLDAGAETADWSSPEGWNCTVGFTFPDSAPGGVGDPICKREGAGAATLALLFPEKDVEQQS